MTSLNRASSCVVLAVLTLALGAQPAKAQDPAKVTPKTHKVALDNERVRVLDIRLKPGEKVVMHSHPAMVIYFVTPAKVRFTFPDGKTAEVEGKAGEAVWTEAVTHAAENIGASELHVLNIELKQGEKTVKQ